MFFSLSTTPANPSLNKIKRIPQSDRIISGAILLIWILLISFAVVSIKPPLWLKNISQSGKNSEAVDTKRYGDRFLAENKFREAIIQYKAALKIQPDYNQALGNLAVAYSRFGKQNRAITILNRMIELIPEESYISEENLAEIYLNNNNLDKAIQYFSSAAEKAPFPSHLYSILGNLHCKNDNYMYAIDAFRSSISTRSDMKAFFQGMLERDYYWISDRPEVQDAIGKLLIDGIPADELNRFDLTVFNQEVLRDREYAISFNNLGWAYEQTGQLDKALIYYQNAIKLYPRYLQAKNNLDALKGKMGE